MDEETTSAEDQRRLRQNAELLSKREREVFALRAKHEQVTRWLKLAQSLPALLTGRHLSKLEMYAHLRKSLILGLRLQRVAFFEIGEQVLTPLAPTGPDRPLAPQAASLLAARARGFCNEPTEPDAAALAADIDLARFVWGRIRLSGQTSVLLVAGYDRSKIAFQPPFDEADAAHIENTAQHIEALLGNAFLVSELERESDHLKRTNLELETRDRELLAATEPLEGCRNGRSSTGRGWRRASSRPPLEGCRNGRSSTGRGWRRASSRPLQLTEKSLSDFWRSRNRPLNVLHSSTSWIAGRCARAGAASFVSSGES